MTVVFNPKTLVMPGKNCSPRYIKEYREKNKISEQPFSDSICVVLSGAAGKPEDLIQVKHRDTGMVIAPGDDDYDSDEELRPELEDGEICFLFVTATRYK